MAAKVTGVLELNNAPFLAALEASKSASKAFTTSVVAGAAIAASAMIVASAGVLAVAMAFKSLGSFLSDGIAGAVAFGNSAYQAAQKFKGISTGENFLWLKALEKSGMSADEALGAMKQMSDQGMKLTEIFSSPADAAEAIKAAKADYGDIASAIDKSAGTMAVMVNNFTAFKDRLQGFFIGFVSQVATPMNDLLVLLKNSFSTTEFGVSLGKKVNDLINILKGGASEGNFGEVVGALIKIALIDGAKKLNEIIKSISAYFSESFKGFGGILQAFGSILKSVFEYGATYISSKLQEAFEAGYKAQAAGVVGSTERKNVNMAEEQITKNLGDLESATKAYVAAKKSGNADDIEMAQITLDRQKANMTLLQADISFNKGNFSALTADQMTIARFRSENFKVQKNFGAEAYAKTNEDFERPAIKQRFMESQMTMARFNNKSNSQAFMDEAEKTASAKFDLEFPESDSVRNNSMFGDNIEAIKNTSKYAGANASMAQAKAEFAAAQANSGAGITGIAGGMEGFISGLEETRTAAQSIVDKARKAGAATAGEPVRPPQVNNILTATPLERITTSLGKIGGGGGSMYVGMDIQAQNAAQTARNTKAAADDLAVIRDKLTTAPAVGGERLMKE
jgi:hypothetical protein